MESFNALGYRPDRAQAYKGDLLSETEDEELSAIVKEAAEDLATPIALVNLVLEQIQFFKAHHGLPPDLVAARGTDRDVSFCQFVVRDGEPFEVNDAEKDERVPKHLVRHYDIRSYLGMPISVDDTVVGSLCVIDTKPREFSNKEKRSLRKLANLVNTRLAQLAEKQRIEKALSKKQNLQKAIHELGSSLSPVAHEIRLGRSGALAIGAFLQLVDFSLHSTSVHPEIIGQALRSAKEALSNVKDRFYGIDLSVDHANASLAVVNNIVNLNASTSLQLVLEGAIKLYESALNKVGGYQLNFQQKDLLIKMSQPLAVSLLSTCLYHLSAVASEQRVSEGIRIDVLSSEKEVTLVMGALKLSTETYLSMADYLHEHLGRSTNFYISPETEALKLVFFR